MLEPAAPPAAELRAYLRIGGIPLARHQLSLALALGCERVICVSRALDPEIVALQHAAEQAGVRFHVVTGPRALISLITANDDVIVLADGLLAAPEEAVTQLDHTSGVWVQPIESGLPSGFERIDLNHAAAGAMRIPGKLVEQLGDLPPDFDAVSALQRIALQKGLPQHMLPGHLRDSGAWRLIRDEAEAHSAEADWIRKQTGSHAEVGPTETAARAAVRSFGPALLHAGSGGNTVAIAAFLLILLAVALAWFGFAVAAFVLIGLGWALRRAAELLLGIERETLRVQRAFERREALFGWIVDAVLVTVAAWNQSGPWSGMGFATRAFPVVMLIAMLRLVPRVVEAPWAQWLEDRMLVCLAFAVIAIGGTPGSAFAGLAVVLALLGVAWPKRPVRLTGA